MILFNTIANKQHMSGRGSAEVSRVSIVAYHEGVAKSTLELSICLVALVLPDPDLQLYALHQRLVVCNPLPHGLQ